MKKMIILIGVLCLLLSVFCCCALAQIDVQSSLFENGMYLARLHIAPDEEPVYILLDQMTIGGVPFFVTGDNFSDMWSGYPHSTEKHTLTYEFRVLAEEGYVDLPQEEKRAAFDRVQAQQQSGEGTEVAFRVTLLAPKQDIVQVDCAFSGDSAAAWQQIDEIIARGDTPAESKEPYTVCVSSSAISSIRFDEPVCFPQGNVEALLEHANMRIVEQQTFHFPLI